MQKETGSKRGRNEQLTQRAAKKTDEFTEPFEQQVARLLRCKINTIDKISAGRPDGTIGHIQSEEEQNSLGNVDAGTRQRDSLRSEAAG